MVHASSISSRLSPKMRQGWISRPRTFVWSKTQKLYTSCHCFRKSYISQSSYLAQQNSTHGRSRYMWVFHCEPQTQCVRSDTASNYYTALTHYGGLMTTGLCTCPYLMNWTSVVHTVDHSKDAVSAQSVSLQSVSLEWWRGEFVIFAFCSL